MTDEIQLDENGTFIGKYELVELLGSGAQGFVYKARHRESDEIVAAKVMKLHQKDDFEYLRRLGKEAEYLRSIDNEHVVGFYDSSFEEDSRPGTLEHFIVTEYIEGQTLGTELSRKCFSEEEVRRVIGALYQGLSAAHEKGITHRDVKPSNVLVGDDGRVVLTDFGVARHNGKKTATGSVGAGSANYMAPEQWEKDEVSAQSDLYSLALIALDMLRGSERDQLVVFDNPLEEIEKYSHTSQNFRDTLRLALSENVSERRRGIEGIVNGDSIPVLEGEIVEEDLNEVEKNVVNNIELSLFEKTGCIIGSFSSAIAASYFLFKNQAGIPISALGGAISYFAGAFVGGGIGYGLNRISKGIASRLPWNKKKELEYKPYRVVELDEEGEKELVWVQKTRSVDSLLELVDKGKRDEREVYSVLLNLGVDDRECIKYNINSLLAVNGRERVIQRVLAKPELADLFEAFLAREPSNRIRTDARRLKYVLGDSTQCKGEEPENFVEQKAREGDSVYHSRSARDETRVKDEDGPPPETMMLE